MDKEKKPRKPRKKKEGTEIVKKLDAEQAVDYDLVDETVLVIQNEVIDAVSGAYIKIGKHLFEKYYESNSDLVKSKNPKKLMSLKHLKNQPIWTFSNTKMYDMLNCAVQDQFFAQKDVDTSHLTYTHLVILTREKDLEHKVKLVEQLGEEMVSSRDLAALLKDVDRKEGRQPPEIAYSPITEAWTLLDKISKDKMLDVPENIASIPPKERTKAKEKIKTMIDQLSKVIGILQQVNKKYTKKRGTRTE